jgi:hypothetical protein
VFVDGAFAGYTPVEFATRPGDRTVEMRLDGYISMVTGVAVAGGEVRNVFLELAPVAAPAPTPPTVLLFDDPVLIGLPGARLLTLEVKNTKREADFSVTTDLDSAYRHFHDQLIANGWSRTELSQRGGRPSTGATGGASTSICACTTITSTSTSTSGAAVGATTTMIEGGGAAR